MNAGEDQRRASQASITGLVCVCMYTCLIVCWSTGNLACSRVAKVSVSPQALLALREQVRALGQEKTHAPLKEAGWLGAEGRVDASEGRVDASEGRVDASEGRVDASEKHHLVSLVEIYAICLHIIYCKLHR